MAGKLLIRIYDVGLGDCIYCRIPDAIRIGGKKSDFHMLIDCGTWSGMPLLEKAMAHLEKELPAAGKGKKRLDLIVVTHEHKDHIAGFGPALFKNLEVGAVWMNCAMDPAHPQAKKSLALKGFAAQAMKGFAALDLDANPALQELVSVFEFSNSEAMATLRNKLLAKGKKPKYVFAGQTNDKLKLPLIGAKIRVLGPERDIDHFYLGKEASSTMKGIAGMADTSAVPSGPERAAKSVPVPKNIGPAAFRQLQARMQSSALAFAELASKVTNNSSVVLLIEWKGKRLLFVGDAEWDGGFKPGKSNGSWNVMWTERKPLLGKPIDFLKIGHHGSENATPWNDNGKRKEPADILEAILPLPQRPGARAVVSTERGKYQTIPRAPLMVEIARRIGGTKNYAKALAQKKIPLKKLPKFDKFEKASIDKLQPLRTDIERRLKDNGFIDVTF